jgi:hypothetical protein
MAKRCLMSIVVILFALFFTFVAGAQIDTQTPKETEIIKYLRQGLIVFSLLS